MENEAAGLMITGRRELIDGCIVCSECKEKIKEGEDYVSSKLHEKRDRAITHEREAGIYHRDCFEKTAGKSEELMGLTELMREQKMTARQAIVYYLVEQKGIEPDQVAGDGDYGMDIGLDNVESDLDRSADKVE